MHHVKQIKGLKAKKNLDWFTIQIAAINRKQVPLCAKHHKKIHNNSLTWEERKLFEDGCKVITGSKKI